MMWLWVESCRSSISTSTITIFNHTVATTACEIGLIQAITG